MPSQGNQQLNRNKGVLSRIRSALLVAALAMSTTSILRSLPSITTMFDDDHSILPRQLASPFAKELTTNPSLLYIMHHDEAQQARSNDTAKSSSSTLSAAKLLLPPTCRVQNTEGRAFDRIHFLHMRKAGGTALRLFFKALEQEHNILVHVDEGAEFPEQPGDYNNTFYVTVIREPVARALSQYKYDQRWDCKTQLNRKRFVPTMENTYTSLEDFVHEPSRFHPEIRGPLWICSSNCYARWATGMMIQHDEYKESKKDATEYALLLEQARRVLNRYNLILVQEWLEQDAEYRAAISRIFSVKLISRRFFAECGRASKKANEKVPLVLDKNSTTLEQLKDNNRVDIALYNELTMPCNSFNFSSNINNVQPLRYISSSRRVTPTDLALNV